MGFDRTAELVRFQNLHRLHATGGAGSLVAHLGEKVGLRGGRFADDAELVELVDERLLPVDMLAVVQGRHHHRAVMMVGGVDDDRVEVAELVGEGLAVVLDLPRLAILLVVHFLEGGLVDVAEAGPFDAGVSLEPLSLHVADPVGADLEDAEIAVLVRRRPNRGGVGCGDGGTEKRGVLQEAASVEGF